MLAVRLLLFCSMTILSFCTNKDNGFSILESTGGNTNIDELTITEYNPTSSSLVIEIGSTHSFYVRAEAPFGRTITYNWYFDSSLVLSGSSQTYSVTATSLNVGNHNLKIVVTDDRGATRDFTWTVKINGPPEITPVTTGIPKVSVGATTNFSVTATDPNSDTLIYTWLLNGASSTNLVGTGNSAVLTGASSEVGTNTVTVIVSDGTASDTHIWTNEVNYFPNACNTMTQGQICTYAGNPHKGNGLDPNNLSYPLRFRPISHAQDSSGNIFISDLDNNVVWFWNKSTIDVTRIGVTVAANTIKVVAGTGEAASGSAGALAVQSALNGPRGLYYHDATDTLYIAEYNAHLVKYINSAGIVSIGFGNGTSNVDGATASSHDCNNPANLHFYNNSLYISCFGTHRVKRWDLLLDQGFTVAGTGANNVTGTNVAANTGGVGSPYAVFADASGVYIGCATGDVVRYVNTTGLAKTFWSGNPDATTINNGNINTIMGNAGTAIPATAALNPKSIDIGDPRAIAVKNNVVYVFAQFRDLIIVGNDSGAPVTFGSRTINHGFARVINSTTPGYNGTGAAINSARVNDNYTASFDVTDPNKIIFSDYANYRLREFNISGGTIDDLIGSGRGILGNLGISERPVQESLFNYPGGVAYESSMQSLFLTDKNNHMIRKIDKYGRVTGVIGTGTAGDPTLDDEIPGVALMRTNYDATNARMTAIDLYTDGSLLQINNVGHNLRLWNRSGAGTTYNDIFISNDRISTIGGNWSSGAGNGPTGNALSAQMNYPSSARFYNNMGNLEIYYADRMNHCIRKIDQNGIMSDVVGTCGTSGFDSNDQPESSVFFNRINDIVFDNLGNLFIADEQNHRIRYWNRTASTVSFGPISIGAGRVTTIACNSGSAGSTSENVLATSARCNTPTGLAFKAGTLCYAQAGRHNVRCINLTTGTVNTVAGKPEATASAGVTLDFSQEGISATSATLYAPGGITFDSSGDLYIADTLGHVVRKVKLTP